MKNQNHHLQDTYRISLQKAARLVYSFLMQPNLEKIGRLEAIGGVIHKSTLKGLGLTYNGSMSWFCRNTGNEKGYPKCFLAFEDAEYDLGNVPRIPKRDKLTFSHLPIMYKEQEISEKKVLNLLLKKVRIPKGLEGEIAKDKVIEFLSDFGEDPIHRNYNRYYCSFFENRGQLNDDMKELVDNPSVQYIKYFFGYDASHAKYYQSNRIRVILIGYSSSDRLISLKQLDERSGLILQDSWPPPPPNTET